MMGVAVLIAFASSHAKPTGCERYSVRDVSIGASFDDVQARLGHEGVIWSLGVGDVETSALDYELPDSMVHVEFDHRIGKRPKARVALVRLSIPSGPRFPADLVDRWGPPSAGQEAFGSKLEGGAAVWVVGSCGLAATVYRKDGSWWGGDQGTVVQIETLERAQQGGSPASATILAMTAHPAQASKSSARSDVPEPPESGQIALPPDTLPVRIVSVAPRYPRHLRHAGVTGRVSLAVTVRDEGSVGAVRLTEVVPRGRGFESAAIAAVQHWVYRPATRRGMPVAAEIPVVVEFK